MQTFARFLCLSSVAFFTLVPSAQAELAGSWRLYPPQTSSYETAVQQPIDADGSSSFKYNGRSVVPVKFKLSRATGPVVLQSIFSDSNPENDYSFLSFRPSSPLLFSELTHLSAVYNFTEGNCHGGALRWEVGVQVSPTEVKAINIYYGTPRSFTECILTPNNQSGLNLLSFTDERFETQQLGGPFYDTLAGALVLAGDKQVVYVALPLDGGWTVGDQRLNPSAVTVNDNTFIPEDSGFVPICDLPPAKIQVTKIDGTPTGPVDEPVSVQRRDNDEFFRIVDCKYMYNLATSSLLGRGRYKVEAVIGGNPVAGAAYFDLR